MARPKREATAAQRALALLVRREHSRPELTRKLVARGIDPAEASAAVTKMSETGWQDDLRFACSLVRSRVARGQGPVRIRAELATHGLDAAVVSAAFEALAEAGEDDWVARARELAQRRFGPDLEPWPVRRKASEFLIRRGFDGDSVRRAVRFDPED